MFSARPARRALVAFAAALTFATLPPAVTGAGWAKTAGYASVEQIDALSLIPRPPDAAATRAELDQMLARQAARTPAEAARATADEKRSVPQFLAGAGVIVRDKDIPLLRALAKRMRATETAVVKPVKAKFARSRPFVTEPRIAPLAKTPMSLSYPSSHAVYGAMLGTVLARMLPEKRDAIDARIKEFADSRVLAGAHHPSDVAAGIMIGKAIAESLLRDAAFAPDYEAARIELRRATSFAS